MLFKWMVYILFDDVHRYAAGLGDACAVQDIGSTWMEYNPDVGGFVDNTNLMMECEMCFLACAMWK